ncbi:MAG TPA: sigma-70 family RNA polymerase sigma factor [Candidatus Polarisedimenticolaceae bacterium]|nr:sigma-70 family RNA polymerase sigma factor [Candidatus Polarisedimenticolaceae bacterium]
MTEERDERRLAALMARWQAGDPGAFDEVYAATAGAVTGYLGRWFGSAAAPDLVQETYLRVVEARRTYRPDMPFRPWLFAIARHVALDAHRRRKRHASRELVTDELPEVPVRASAEEHVNGGRLVESLRKLPAGQDELVWLAKVEGMTSTEIGRIVGASPGAVKVRLHRALNRLKSLVDHERSDR